MHIKHALQRSSILQSTAKNVSPSKLASAKKALGLIVADSLKINRQDMADKMSSTSRPIVFTRSMRSSLTTDRLIAVGTGNLNPTVYVDLFMAHTRYNSASTIDSLLDEVKEVFKNLSHDSSNWRKLVASIVGTDSRVLSGRVAPKVTPSMLLKFVSQQFPNQSHVVQLLLTDFVGSMLRETGWLLHDEPYVYKMARGKVYPSMEDLVDVVALGSFHAMLTSMTASKLAFKNEVIDSDGRLLINPVSIAASLTQSTLNAYSMAEYAYDPQSVVSAVFAQLVRIWLPEELVPGGVSLSSRLAKSDKLSELSQNLALFCACQDWLAKGNTLINVPYTDEHMISEIIPLFYNAISQHGPFKIDVLSNISNHVGKRSAKNHLGEPFETILYEDWSYDSETVAFSTVKHLNTSTNGVFIVHEPTASTALQSALKPIADYLSMQTLVDQRLDSVDLKYANDRMSIDGASITLALASELLDKKSSHGEGEKGESGEETGYSRDTLMTLIHLAASKADRVYVRAITNSGNAIPVLEFTTGTRLVNPLGLAAIYQSQVTTWEPLELLIYVDDFTAVKPLHASTLDVKSSESLRSVHLWAVKDNSLSLQADATYSASIRNTKVAVKISEWEAFGLGLRRRKLFFMRPQLTAAHITHWIQWNKDEIDLLDAYATQRSKDPIVAAATAGRKTQLIMSLAIGLARIGSKGVGANVANVVRHKITEELYAKGAADDENVIHVGIERNRLLIWSGIATMLLLGVIETSDATWLKEIIEQNDALANMVAANVAV